MAIDWTTTFNGLRDTALQRLDTLQRIRKLHERARANDLRVRHIDERGAFATVTNVAHEDHRDAVRPLVEHARTAPLDDLRRLSPDAQATLGVRLAELGADEGEAHPLAVGLALGASPYPLLARPAVVARDDLLELVLARCTSEALNGDATDALGLRVWETVVLPYNVETQGPTAPGATAWVERLATVVLPRLAKAGADLDRPLLGELGECAARATPSAREQQAHLLATALVRHRGDVLRQSLAGTGGEGRARKRL
ncbi:hypothetical protein SAMN05216466_106127 [Paraburkholderia phenazinium]|uniref:Uncharacterized protein n=1 Tax=Paraburkholderia phenazinium TaxID=60549 RepID=A0A1G7YCL4_9BURK|nr:hypothetical protein [Paraburkholderia phenazinium]SDG94075.1 hypothetical protein SAMN05216466_106127 [Paraburkholderia phenazinium]